MSLKILLANDDGINAPGIRVLQNLLATYYDVYLIAPAQERSTTSHTITLDRPVSYQQHSAKEYACSGYPADCILMATNTVFADQKFDLVVSGINRGANLGQDIYYSGTVAAAREAVFQAIPAFAVSLVLDDWRPEEKCYYATAAELVLELIRQEAYLLLAPYQLLNINVPNLPVSRIQGLGIAPLGLRSYQKKVVVSAQDYIISSGQATSENWMKSFGRFDVDLIREHKVSCSVLNLFAQSTDKLNQWHDLESKFFTRFGSKRVATGSN